MRDTLRSVPFRSVALRCVALRCVALLALRYGQVADIYGRIIASAVSGAELADVRAELAIMVQRHTHTLTCDGTICSAYLIPRAFAGL
eukprot:COSAG05_NODE_5215_length_1234_cov_1.577093_1_plen_88_part_00